MRTFYSNLLLTFSITTWLSLVTTYNCNAQTDTLSFEDYADYTEFFDHHVQYDSSQFTSGRLYDRSYHKIDPTEIELCDTLQSADLWQITNSLLNCSFDDSEKVEFHVADSLSHFHLRRNQVPVFSLNMKADRIVSQEIADESFELMDGKYRVKEGFNPYVLFNTTLSGLTTNTFETETNYNIFLDNNFVFSNRIQNITSARILIPELNFDIEFTWGDTIELRSDQIGDFTMKTELLFSDNITRCNHSKITFSKKRYKATNTCEDGELWIIESKIPYKGLTESFATTSLADAHIYYHKTEGDLCKIMRPIVIVDGFDPLDQRGHKQIKEVVNYGVNKQKNVIETLQEKGYDVIVLNFPVLGSEAIANRSEVKQFDANGYFIQMIDLEGRDGGADYVERNAFLTVELIQSVNQKLSNNGSDAELIVIGPSMGGLITRYALAYMEKEQANGAPNFDHNTRLWLSFDAPHKGAHISMSTQFMLDYYGNFLKDRETAAIFNKRLRSFAARQMLIQSYGSNFTGYEYRTKEIRSAFKESLTNNGLPNSNGFPENLRKICLINGRTDGEFELDISSPDIHMQILRNDKEVFSNKLNYYKHEYKVNTLFEGCLKQKGFMFDNFYSRTFSDDGYGFEIQRKDRFGVSTLTSEMYYGSPSDHQKLDYLQGSFYPPVKELSDRLIETLEKQKESDDEIVVSYEGSDFTFIPTASALSLNIPDSEWPDVVSRNQILCNNLSPFDNIYSPSANQIHLQVTEENANWIYQEIDKGTKGCQKICATKGNWPSKICPNTSVSLSLNNLPSGGNFDIHWDTDEEFTIQNGQGTSQVNILASSDPTEAHQTILTTITSNCQADLIIKHSTEIPLAEMNISGPEQICEGNQSIYYATSNADMNSLSWHFSDMVAQYFNGGPYSTIWLTSTPDGGNSFAFGGTRIGDYTLHATATNECNENMSADFGLTILPSNHPNCNGTLKNRDHYPSDQVQLTVLPNPTHDYWQVYPSNPLLLVNGYNIYDQKGRVVRKVHLSEEQYVLDINSNGLPRGVYLLQVRLNNGEHVSTQIIRH